MDLVWFGHQNWRVCWTTKQQLTTRLVKHGHKVLYIDPRPNQDLPQGERLQELYPNLFLLQHAPPRSPRIGRWTRALDIRRTLSSLGMMRPTVITSQPMSMHWLRAAAGPWKALAYYCHDEWTAFDLTEAQRRRMRQQEVQLVAATDVAMAVSDTLVDRLQRIKPNSHLLPNGSDVDRFAPDTLATLDEPEVLRDIPHPRLGFVGQLDHRLDQQLLLKLAQSGTPDRPWQVVLVGRVAEGVDIEALRDAPNIHLTGFQPYEDLPAFHAGFDVCLVPYGHGELSDACNPLKVYDYLATGKPVVTRPLPGLTSLREVLHEAESMEQFIDTVARVLDDPDAGHEQRLAAAAACSWEARMETFAQHLQDAEDRHLRRLDERPAIPLDPKEDAARQLSDWWPSEPGSGRRALLRGAVSVTAPLRAARQMAAPGQRHSLGRILVVRDGQFGDLIALIPALRALRRGYPNAQITLATGAVGLAKWLYNHEQLVDHFVDTRPLRHGSAVQRYAHLARLMARGYDLMLGTEWYFTPANLYLCGAPQRISLATAEAQRDCSTRSVPQRIDEHEADALLKLAEAAGGIAHGDARVPTLQIDPDGNDWQALRDKLAIADDQRVVVMHPGSKRHSRRWPTDRFAALAARLIKQDPQVRVIFTGVGDEAPTVQAVLDALPEHARDRAQSVAGETSLNELAVLIAGAAAVVSNDTGVMHLARSLGAPLLALLGAENHHRWGPHRFGPGPAIAIRHATPCGPCSRDHCEAHHCMTALEVDEAFAAVDQLLNHPPVQTELDLRLQTLAWSDLPAAALPHVSIVLTGSVADTDRARDALSGVDYPAIDARVEHIAAPDDADLFWREVGRAVQGDFVLVVQHAAQLESAAIDEDVAALVRSPEAVAVSEGRLIAERDEAELLDHVPIRRVMVRRSALNGEAMPKPAAEPQAVTVSAAKG